MNADWDARREAACSPAGYPKRYVQESDTKEIQ